MSDKLKNTLVWMGSVLAGVAGIVYFILTVIMIMGIHTSMDPQQRLLFTILGAVSGFLINMSLTTQGIQLAQKENKKLLDEYNSLLFKKKKKLNFFDTIEWYMIRKTVTTLIFKAGSVGVSTYLIIYIFFDGNGDFSLIFIALSNIIMFTGFGLLSMSKSYEHYNNKHIVILRERITRLKDKEIMTNLPSIEGQEINNDIQI